MGKQGVSILIKEETKNLKFSKEIRLWELYTLILRLSLIGMWWLREWLATVGHGSAAIEGSSLVTSRHECMCCHERICDFSFEHGAAMNVVAMTKVQTRDEQKGRDASAGASVVDDVKHSGSCEKMVASGAGVVGVSRGCFGELLARKRTPPCTEALIEAKVETVVVGMVDPNPIVAFKGVEILRDAEIEVVVGVEEELCKSLNEPYIHRMLTKNLSLL
ncbi:cytidine/deoxycytidylate deaminase family protein [Vigna unguiculata]|uniref:Cytidine/deoxycytidylate deaminase family protein n=1 Tax=Vigna unguiculata TaxID=3917 RepID=A0A4D6KNZ8_VIGUN|nr:cytidine/deoxycytidylate deaminase family protein [Vigna unguiculata]